MALVCGRAPDRVNRSRAFNFGQQIFWHQFVVATHLRFVLPGQHTLL